MTGLIFTILLGVVIIILSQIVLTYLMGGRFERGRLVEKPRPGYG